MLGTEELSELFDKIYDKLMKELTLANRTSKEELDKVLEKYGLLTEKEDTNPYIDLRNAKILIVGNLEFKARDIPGLCRSINFDFDRLDFVSYDDATNYNYENLRFSNKYSDVIFGGTPHMGGGIGDSSSIISFLESNSSEFPNVIRAETSNELGISKTSLKNALMRTRVYLEIWYN